MPSRNIAELTGEDLDEAVALAEGWVYDDGYLWEPGRIERDGSYELPSGQPCLCLRHPERYSEDWRVGGPIIERERIELANEIDSDVFREGAAWWTATVKTANFKTQVWRDFTEQGETALIAAMRAYVASKFGETVDLP